MVAVLSNIKRYAKVLRAYFKSNRKRNWQSLISRIKIEKPISPFYLAVIQTLPDNSLESIGKVYRIITPTHCPR
jgi:hypothetical protein